MNSFKKMVVAVLWLLATAIPNIGLAQVCKISLGNPSVEIGNQAESELTIFNGVDAKVLTEKILLDNGCIDQNKKAVGKLTIVSSNYRKVQDNQDPITGVRSIEYTYWMDISFVDNSGKALEVRAVTKLPATATPKIWVIQGTVSFKKTDPQLFEELILNGIGKIQKKLQEGA
jgi:hypothetical protein